MGVANLWGELRPAAVEKSFTTIAVDGFNQNSTARGYRVGIDASIWFVHAAYGKEGENPELRTCFFRLAGLLKLPFLPVFVFDGPMRPDVKRGKMIDKKPHWMVEGTKRMVEAFGFEWRTAPGEAEAELAYLNRIGVIDAVWSDDVDTLLFGATMVIRNSSENLSGNRANAQTTKNHTFTYSAENIASHPKVKLTYKDLILVALFSGGDYHKGPDGCGITAAIGLARAGFGDSLVAKVKSLALSVQHTENKRTRVTLHGKEKQELDSFLAEWRAEVVEELRTNSRKFLSRKNTRAANSILAMGSSFPDVDVLMAYINPVTSEERAVAKAVRANPTASGASLSAIVNRARDDIARQLRETITWPRDPSVRAIAKLCEDYFEWGYKERMIYRFGRFLWDGIVCRVLRRETIIADSGRRKPAEDGREILETPSQPLILKIALDREHITTNNMLEYRLQIDPRLLVQVAENGIEGRRSAPSTGWSEEEDFDGLEDKTTAKGADSVDPDAPKRYWLPACMVEKGYPELAAKYEEAKRLKELKKTTKGTGRAKSTTTTTAKAKSKAESKSRAKAPRVEDDTGEPSTSPVITPNVTPRKPKTGRVVDDELVHSIGPRGTVNNFFAASKTSIPSDLRSQKPQIPRIPSTSSAQDPPVPKTKPKISKDTSTSRVAALFEGQEIKIFKDLTKRKDSGGARDVSRPKPSLSQDSGFFSGEPSTPTSRGESSHASLNRTWTPVSESPMRSIPDCQQPEAGPSKPAPYLTNTTRTSTWKPTPFPMSELDFFAHPDSPEPEALSSEPPSPGRRRTRRTSSPPPPPSAGTSTDELQKSPRKSKKQASPRASVSVSPSRRAADEDVALEPLEPLRLVPKGKAAARAPPRRAVVKDRPPVERVIEISSDSDSPPPTRQRTLNTMLTVKKSGAVANEGKRASIRMASADVDVIDLCSD